MKLKARHVLTVYWRAVRKYKALLFFMMLGVVAATTLEVIVPLYYKKFFDVLSDAGRAAEASPKLVEIIWVILLLHLVMWFFYRGATFLNSRFQAWVMADLKQLCFEYLLGHSHGFFANSFVGSLVQKINRMARAFERIADRLTWNIIPVFIRIVGVTIGLWFLNHTITYIIIGWAVSFITFNYFFSRWKLKYDVLRAAADTRTTAVLADNITNHNTIQLFTGVETENQRYKKATEEQRNLTFFVWNLDGVVDAVQALLIVLAEFFLFYFSIRYWERGLITIGTFVLIQTYLVGLVGRLWDFARVVRDLYESFADGKEMAEILYLPQEIRDVPAAKVLAVPRGEIKFADVSFSFHQTRAVLKKISFTIRPGEKIALVGPSGAGKSTIIKLLFRLYEVGEGKIVIDGQDIHSVTQESLRKNLSLVPQDPVLFHRTLLENIRYGRRGVGDEEAKEAARLAHCEEFIKDLPLGYETYVGERGIKLSGGERQRVAIARAMLKNAPILVLDEATSSLDSHSEMLIQDALEKLMRGKTTVVIAHRLSTIRQMDRILVIDNGTIIEEGTHDSLTANSQSLYKKLWTLQAGGFFLDEDNIL